MKSEQYFRELGQLSDREYERRFSVPKFPKQPAESVAAGEDYYDWCAREFNGESYAFKVIHSRKPLRCSIGSLDADSELDALLLLFQIYPQCLAIFVKGE